MKYGKIKEEKMDNIAYLRYSIMESAMACQDAGLLDFISKLLIVEGVERS